MNGKDSEKVLLKGVESSSDMQDQLRNLPINKRIKLVIPTSVHPTPVLGVKASSAEALALGNVQTHLPASDVVYIIDNLPTKKFHVQIAYPLLESACKLEEDLRKVRS
jgi:hypothetical protein